MDVRYLVSKCMYHINKTKVLVDTDMVNTEYVPSDNGKGVYVFIDYDLSKYYYFLSLNIYRQKEFKIYTQYSYVTGNVYTAKNTVPDINIDVYINSSIEPYNYNNITAELYEVITHEFEHVFQDDYNKKQFRPKKQRVKRRAILKNPKLYYKYYLLSDEIFPLVKGLKRKSKFKKTLFKTELDLFLNIQCELGNINADKIEYVKKKILEYYGRIYT